MLLMALLPAFSGTNTLMAALGIIGMSLNGVPVYGAQEAEGANAVELDATTQGVPAWGHAALSGDWHYHSGKFGLVNLLKSYQAAHCSGTQWMGFPSTARWRMAPLWFLTSVMVLVTVLPTIAITCALWIKSTNRWITVNRTAQL
jgi:hypothetical protein